MEQREERSQPLRGKDPSALLDADVTGARPAEDWLRPVSSVKESDEDGEQGMGVGSVRLWKRSSLISLNLQG